MLHSSSQQYLDLSEYNMLYHNGTLFVIDVSQSVEHDHPHSLQFLRSDIINVNACLFHAEVSIFPPGHKIL